MNTVEIKNKFDVLLKKLSVERSFDVAEKITVELVELLNIKAKDRFLVNIPRVDAELTRFQLAPGFARQAAAYELPHEDNKPIDLKLFWVKKTSKTNLSWLIGLTPNFEDALSNDYKNIGIDFVVPEACDSITVLLSNRFKIRALELKDHITPTQLEIFTQWAKLSEMDIADQNELKNTLHAKLWESFNFEPINRKFYLELVEHFSILVHHLEKDFARKQSVMFTTRLIGRLLFIWFLKKKSLVNDKVDYFSVSNPEKQKEYYENKLEKLFFEVLNREELERDNGDKLTPYLNGGLFDKNATDFYDDPKLTFPNGYFNQLFSTLNKYNFTVDESSPEFQHVAIDPEMLGRIFESLLAEQIDENTGNSKKKATGAFYTPREIVSYMCEQSLIEYLKTKVPDAPDRDRRIDELVRMPEAIFRDQDQNKRRDWKPYRESIIKALEGSKTESPLTVLDPAVGSGAFPMGMLHLLVKVYSRLDPKFEKDISGLKRDILSRSLYGVDIEQTAIEICRLRAWLSLIVDIPEGEKVEPLPNLEFKFVCANTLIPLEKDVQGNLDFNSNLKSELIKIRDEYFKTSSKTKKDKLQKEYNKLTQQSIFIETKGDKQLKSYRPFDISSSSEFYDPELMHGVPAFDIVIGNPPYVNVKNSKQYNFKKEYSKLYKTALGQFDLFCLFTEKGLLLTRGVISYIVPKPLVNNENYKIVREILIKNGIFQLVIGSQIFEAGVESCIFFLDKNLKNDFLAIYEYTHTDGFLFKRNVKANKSYELPFSMFPVAINEDDNSLIKKIEANSVTLKDYLVNTEIVRGVECGKKDKSITVENTGFPILKGEDVSKYLSSFDNKYIKFDENDLKKFKKLKLYQHPKILVRRVGNNITAFYDVDNYVVLNTLYCIPFNTPELTGILNSNLIDFWFKKIFVNNDKLFPYIRKSQLEKIPIKNAISDNKNLYSQIGDIVLKIQEKKKNNVNADVKNLESQIDQLVYKLYDLTQEEIEIIENESNK
jgi:hypothetical protein